MNSVEMIKSVCKERKIPVSRLEKELGFGNGYISQLKKGTMPYERLIQVANYLNVSAEFLTGENENKPTNEGELTEVQCEAMELIKEMSDDQLRVFIATLKATRGI